MNWIKLSSPVENFSFSSCAQLFGMNKEFYQSRFTDLYAHNGIDIVFPGQPKNGYGAKILAAHDGTVSKVIFDSYPLHTKGNGIYIDYPDDSITTVYWHCSEILITGQKEVKAGEVIALAGNTGLVYPTPTKELPYNAVHLHFGVIDNSTVNEYKGHVDPVPYLFKLDDKLPVKFDHDLSFGMEEDAISWLQTIMKIEFPDITFQPVGFFGSKTLEAVKRFQERYGVTPAYGFCGSKTRAVLNAMYT